MSPDPRDPGTSEVTAETPQTWVGQEDGMMMVTELKYRGRPRAELSAGEERSNKSWREEREAVSDVLLRLSCYPPSLSGEIRRISNHNRKL